MQGERPGTITQLLRDWGGGDESALSSLLPMVYEELRTMASRQLRRERSSHTLQRTALVNEAFMRLVDQRQVDWQNRAHFFSIASRIMRRILVDHARKHRSNKRGGDAERLSLDATGRGDGPPDSDALLALVVSDESRFNLEEIDEVLKRLETMDPRLGKLVELRFFGGLSIEETAGVLGISVSTVKREWMSARAWLHRELAAE